MPGKPVFEPESVRITDQIRNEIVDGVRAPGSKLVERELADELGVSRLPIRDALKTLVAEGIVTPRPRTWAVVREFTPSDIADFNEVRGGLELMSFKMAAQRHSRQGLAELREVLDRELLSARNDDAVTSRRAGAQFHEIVTKLASNDLLIELNGILSSRMRWLLSQHDDLIAMAQEHEELYQAIAARDVLRLDALVRTHLETSLSSIMTRIGTVVVNAD